LVRLSSSQKWIIQEHSQFLQLQTMRSIFFETFILNPTNDHHSGYSQPAYNLCVCVCVHLLQYPKQGHDSFHTPETYTGSSSQSVSHTTCLFKVLKQAGWVISRMALPLTAKFKPTTTKIGNNSMKVCKTWN
jgi:hypothetical protein